MSGVSSIGNVQVDEIRDFAMLSLIVTLWIFSWLSPCPVLFCFVPVLFCSTVQPLKDLFARYLTAWLQLCGQPPPGILFQGL